MKKKYFNKKIFQVCLALTLILLGTIMIQYGDYKEYTVYCNDVICEYNVSFLEDLYIIESDLQEGRIDQYGIMYSNEKQIYSNYSFKPFLVKHFFNIMISMLLFDFLINHIWFKMKNKESYD